MSVASVFIFAFVSYVASWQPSTRQFNGWVVILSASDGSWDNQVKLVARAVEPGVLDERPLISYTASVCGKEKFRGVLLIGGNARLDQVKISTGVKEGPRGTLRVLPDLEISSTINELKLIQGPVQVVDLEMAPTPCAAPYSSVGPIPPFMGHGIEVIGRAQSPVQNTGPNWSPIEAPRATQIWPLIGAFQELPLGNLGEFHTVGNLKGSWIRPPRQYFAVEAGVLTPRASVDQVRPETVNSQSLTWEGSRPIRASAQVVDTENLSRWQQALVAAGILLGIGGSILATLLLDLSRQPSPPATVASNASQPGILIRNARSPHFHMKKLSQVAAILMIIALLLRKRNRNDRIGCGE